MRLCTSCLVDQPITQFGEYTTGSGKKRRRRQCNQCRRVKQAKRYAENSEVRDKMRETASAYHLMSRYGLSPNEFKTMVIEREGLCDICKIIMPKPNVDHCHRTGTVRGLLCWECNIGLGKFRDSVDNLKQAITYLERN